MVDGNKEEANHPRNQAERLVTATPHLSRIANDERSTVRPVHRPFAAGAVPQASRLRLVVQRHAMVRAARFNGLVRTWKAR
jgi:hypothetical protein